MDDTSCALCPNHGAKVEVEGLIGVGCMPKRLDGDGGSEIARRWRRRVAIAFTHPVGRLDRNHDASVTDRRVICDRFTPPSPSHRRWCKSVNSSSPRQTRQTDNPEGADLLFSRTSSRRQQRTQPTNQTSLSLGLFRVSLYPAAHPRTASSLGVLRYRHRPRGRGKHTPPTR